MHNVHVYAGNNLTGLAVRFTMHDCYSELNGVAAFSVVMCHGLICDWKTANQFQEIKLFPGTYMYINVRTCMYIHLHGQ